MMTVGMKVSAYNSRCVGVVIDSYTYEGEISKINKNSIRVAIKSVNHKNGKHDFGIIAYSTEKKFDLWKVVNGKALYKNSTCGIIEIAC